MNKKLTLAAMVLVLWLASLACNLQDALNDIDFPDGFEVTKTQDTFDGECTFDDCSLRDAIVVSNQRPGHDTITIPDGTYYLIDGFRLDDTGRYGDLDITDDLTIIGAGTRFGEGYTEIVGNNHDRIFHILAGVTVEIQGLRIRTGNGNDPAYNANANLGPPPGFAHIIDEIGGGGIANRGDLKLTNVWVSYSTADKGGGILNLGQLTLVSVFIVNNTGSLGGGIFNGAGSRLTIGVNPNLSTVISSNSAAFGGGIYNDQNGIVIIRRAQIEVNEASENGGGVYNSQNAFLWLENAGIRLNNANGLGGGVFNRGAAELISQNERPGPNFDSNTAASGGGFFNGFNSEATIEETFFQFNTANAGGGFFNQGEMTILRSLVYKNEAAEGAGLLNDSNGTLDMTNVTISTNLGSGALNDGGILSLHNVTVFNNTANSGVRNLGGSFTVLNTLLAENGGGNCVGVITSLGYNLDSAATCNFGNIGDVSNIDPLLGPLFTDYNFPPATRMHLLDSLSPAIDIGDLDNCPLTDQSGEGRPMGFGCDIGAHEMDITIITIPGGSIPSIVTGEQDTNCRIGPSTVYGVAGLLKNQEVANVIGRNRDASWWKIVLTDGELECWVWDGAVVFEGDEDEVTIIPDPATPTAVFLTPTPTAVPPSSSTQPPSANSAISGIVWEDQDGGADIDGGESRFNSATLELRNGSCGAGVAQTTTTNSSGQYSFSGLQAGTYCVRVVLPAGNWDATVPDFPAYEAPTQEITLGASESIGGVNFGLQIVIQ